jgi:hypothetical protein
MSVNGCSRVSVRSAVARYHRGRGFRGPPGDLGQHAGVGVRGEDDRRMTEHLRDGLHVGASVAAPWRRSCSRIGAVRAPPRVRPGEAQRDRHQPCTVTALFVVACSAPPAPRPRTPRRPPRRSPAAGQGARRIPDTGSARPGPGRESAAPRAAACAAGWHRPPGWSPATTRRGTWSRCNRYPGASASSLTRAFALRRRHAASGISRSPTDTRNAPRSRIRRVHPPRMHRMRATRMVPGYGAQGYHHGHRVDCADRHGRTEVGRRPLFSPRSSRT